MIKYCTFLDIYDIMKNKNGGDNYVASGNEST